MGNTCFCAAAVQMFYSIHTIRHALIQYATENDPYTPVGALAHLVKNIDENIDDDKQNGALTNVVATAILHHEGGDQAATAELIASLFTEMEKNGHLHAVFKKENVRELTYRWCMSEPERWERVSKQRFLHLPVTEHREGVHFLHNLVSDKMETRTDPAELLETCAGVGQMKGRGQIKRKWEISPRALYFLVEINRVRESGLRGRAQNTGVKVICNYDMMVGDVHFILHGVVQHVRGNHYTFGLVTGARADGSLRLTVYDDAHIHETTSAESKKIAETMLSRAVYVVYRRSTAKPDKQAARAEGERAEILWEAAHSKADKKQAAKDAKDAKKQAAKDAKNIKRPRV